MGYDFTAYGEMLEKLKELSVRCPPKRRELHRSIKRIIDILKEVVESKEAHPYFKRCSPYEVGRDNYSQARSITIIPEHLRKLANSILKVGVKAPLLLREYSTTSSEGKSSGLIDGCHRDDMTRQLMEKGLLEKGYKYPTISIPAAVFHEISRALRQLQAAANDHDPREGNNENDMQKDMEGYIEEHLLDLNNEDDFSELVEMIVPVYSSHDPKTVKGNATRLKNKINSKRSDVFSALPKDFLTHYSNALKSGDLSASAEKFFVSTKGSTLQQLLMRSAHFMYDNPSRKIEWVFGCQDNKGDSQTTINSRIAFFEYLYKNYLTFSKNHMAIPFHSVIVSPQNTGVFVARIGDQEIETKAEQKEIASNWKRITRKEILDHFASNPSSKYKKQWIVSGKTVQGELKEFPRKAKKGS